MSESVLDNASTPITVVIIHDEPAITAGFAAWYQLATPAVTVVASGADPALAWSERGAAAEVVLFGLHFGDPMARRAELRRLLKAGRRVLLHTADRPFPEIEAQGLRCLPRRVTRSQLIGATRMAARGTSLSHPPVVSIPALSPREVDVLRTWLRCRSKSSVATELQLSARTVSSYLERIRFKYEHAGRPASTKTDLLARALQDGLITLAEI